MTTSTIKLIALKKASDLIGISAKTLREKANAGIYPTTIIKKVGGSWMVDSEEWDRWHRIQ